MEKKSAVTSISIEVGMTEIRLYQSTDDGVASTWRVSFCVNFTSHEDMELPAEMTEQQAKLAAKRWASSYVALHTDIQNDATREFFAELAQED